MLVVPHVPISRFNVPTHPPTGCHLTGSWGDVIAGLGCVQAVARKFGPQRVMVTVPEEPEVVDPTFWLREWLWAQPGVMDTRRAVAGIGMKRPPCDVRGWNSWCIAAGRDDLRGYWPCHPDFTLERRRVPVMPQVQICPMYENDLRGWHVLPERGSYVLFQPMSEASCSWRDHWPWWDVVARTLQQAQTVVHVGLKPSVEFTRGYNLIGQTTRMPDVFGLADHALFTVTTSNSLAMYCAARRLPCVACENATHQRGMHHFFTEFMKKGGVEVVHYWEGVPAYDAALVRVKARASG